MTQKIVFEQKTDRIVVAFIKKAKIDIRGKRFFGDEATRAIKEFDGWRVDKCAAVAGAWMPWEAITSEVFPTLDAAKETIVAYANAEPRS